jgi:glycosyltransferase involved in cell wall biosynthesis
VNSAILYISYDGVLEPLGESQVISYLEKLAPGRRIHLISFEKEADWADQKRRSAFQRRLGRVGILWHPLRYHKSPSGPATAYDITAGYRLASALIRRHRLNIVHARSYVAATMAFGAKLRTGVAFLFDMRGFWADERVDGGLWRRGQLYRIAKTMERRLLLAADHVVTLTNASSEEIATWSYLSGRVPPITVIPTCVDLSKFAFQASPPPKPYVLGYVGSVGTWYLLDEMLGCFKLMQSQQHSRLLIVNRSEQEMIRQRAAANGIDDRSIEIVAAEHGDVARQIGRMTGAMALIKPCYSKIASSPTKLAEYLGCGVPCLGNAGVGDIEDILEGQRVGAVVSDVSNSSLADGVRRLADLSSDAAVRRRCREVATRLFSLDSGVAAYADIYATLSETPS